MYIYTLSESGKWELDTSYIPECCVISNESIGEGKRFRLVIDEK